MFKIIDYSGQTVKDGFKTSRDAWCWLMWRFTNRFINEMEYNVIREEEEDEHSET